jgi:fructose-specific phosphotransferase system IIC component
VLKEGSEDDLAAALHSTSAFDRSSPRSTSAWIFASVIVDRTHAACWFGMEAPSATISPLGLELDLILHKVLTRMHKRSTAWSGGACTCLAELEAG